MNDDRLNLIEQKVEVLRNDMEAAISSMLQDLAQTLTRMAQTIAKDMEEINVRVTTIEDKMPYNVKHPKEPKPDGGIEL